VGVLVHGDDGTAQAGLSVSMPSVCYQPAQLESLVTTLTAAARRLETTLATTP
jgi:DNA-binding IclR family transcriptional regulator